MLTGYAPPPPVFVETYRRHGYYQGTTLGEYLHAWADQFGDREAIVSGEQRITYAQLDERVDRLAAALLRLGIRPTERVVVQLPNVADFIVLSFALFRIGALPIMALPAHREYEITNLVAHGEAVAYAVPAAFGSFDYLDLARTVRGQQATLRHILVSEGNGASDVSAAAGSTDIVGLRHVADAITAPRAELRAELLRYRPDPADVALFLLSGGTTGVPKLIPRTHDDYAYNLRGSAEVCGLTADTVYLVTLPVAHNFPLACPGVLGTLWRGGRVVLAPNPDPETVFPLIQRERVTATAVVPALAIRWMDSPLLAGADLTSLKLLQVGGARLNPEAARRVRPTLGCQLQQVFGMAEGLLNYTRLDDPEEVIVETQGRPMSPHDEIRIVDDDGRDVPAGEMGQLLTRGPYTLRGYFNAPEANKTAFSPDGFYRSGDVVRLHPSGNLVVEGRDKDLINRGGEKISAEEVENLILAHPKVLNVAAVAMPDPVLGERTCAFVVLREGEGESQSLTLDELVSFLRARKVATFKLPERLEVLASLPVTAVGKVNKKALRERIAAQVIAEQQVR